MLVGILIVLLCVDTFMTGQLMMRVRKCEQVYEDMGIQLSNYASDLKRKHESNVE